jgi:hypothetical protein
MTWEYPDADVLETRRISGQFFLYGFSDCCLNSFILAANRPDFTRFFFEKNGFDFPRRNVTVLTSRLMIFPILP